MKLKEKKSGIYFGSICWKDVGDLFITVVHLGIALDEQLTVSDYGDELQKITFIPIGVKPSNKIHQERFRYSSKKKAMTIQKKMDYHLLETYTLAQFQEQVALLFLECIDDFKKHSLKTFDIAAFKRDVQRVFRQEGWIKMREAA